MFGLRLLDLFSIEYFLLGKEKGTQDRRREPLFMFE